MINIEFADDCYIKTSTLCMHVCESARVESFREQFTADEYHKLNNFTTKLSKHVRLLDSSY